MTRLRPRPGHFYKSINATSLAVSVQHTNIHTLLKLLPFLLLSETGLLFYFNFHFVPKIDLQIQGHISIKVLRLFYILLLPNLARGFARPQNDCTLPD